MDTFTHLHVHSHYSLLDGMSKINELVDKCLRTGMHSMALTDHGNMYGVKDFLDYSKKVNGAAKGKVKDCKERIAKAKERIAEKPKWEKVLSEGRWPEEDGGAELTEHDRKDVTQKLQDSKTAEKALPKYEEELPQLEKKAAEFIPFKPIVGVEAYCARRSRLDKDRNVKYRNTKGKEKITDSSGWHLILLAKNIHGYRNLCRMVSISFIDGFYGKPRIDKQLIEEYHEGLICCSACLGGELPQLIMQGKRDEAEKSAQWFKSIFGDDYYIEIQRHQTDKVRGNQDTYQQQMLVNPVLMEIAANNGIKVICTNDAHFVEEEHADAHELLVLLNTGRTMADINKSMDDETDDNMAYTKQEWLKTPEEMAAIFSDVPEALANTQEIVDKIETYDIDCGPIMPKFPIPEEFGTESEWRNKYTEQDLFDEFTRDENGKVVLSQEAAEKKIKALGGYEKLYRIKFEADYLAKLTWEGARKRYGDRVDAETPEGQALRERINFELHVMKTMGFPGYFLIVYDYIRAAREELGVSVGPGRGSAAGSVVAYCLRITDVDPLPYDLLFERFLNPDRISLPDIDVDFDDAGRGKVLDWVSGKYGKTHVAHIITYGTMASKSAIADVGRVLNIPLPEVNKIKSYVPERSFPDNIKDEKGKSPKVNLTNCYKYVKELRDILGSDNEEEKAMLHYADELEDTIRQVGIHACGVIIGADDLTKFAPLATVKDRASGKDIMVTQYDGHVVESVGLIKMDFLGLITLTIIKETLENIKKTHNGLEVDIDHIPVDDELTYKLFQEGRTIATFQFESAGMQKYLRELKPTVLPDLIAMNALYRPGPMDYIPQFIRRKNGLEPIEYDIPIMETYLKDTYGITVYQEQVMLLSRLLAGFTRGESDSLRKAMGKKKKDIVDAMKPKFIEGGRKRGYDSEILDKIWTDWEKFASYAFNKSHATCYAWVAYQTGYLKAHYPAEFMAANLTVSKDDITKVTKLMEECKDLRIKVLPPDVNESDLNFMVNEEGNIRFGLGGIKGVGEGAVIAILNERKSGGKFTSIFDFVERVSLTACNRKVIESLATSGAFDCFQNFYREQLFATNSKGDNVLDTIMRYGNRFQAEKQEQQNSLFSMFGDEGGVEIQHPEMPQTERWGTIERLNKEKNLIGIYLSAHPLDEYEFELNEMCDIHTDDMNYFSKWNRNLINQEDPSRNRPRAYVPAEGEPDPQEWLLKHEDRQAHIGGIITSFTPRVSRNGNSYAEYTLEDYLGSYTFTLFGQDFVNFGPRLQPNSFVFITGVFQQRGAERIRQNRAKFRNSKPYEPLPFDQAEYEFLIKEVESLDGLQAKSLREIVLEMPIENIHDEFNQLLRDECERLGEEIENQRKAEKKANVHPNQQKQFAAAALKVILHDETNQTHIQLSSSKYQLFVDRPFYAFLQDLRKNGTCDYRIVFD
ncbi:MAG: DNA polymerase III subunit alpha [Paludibacteraceae bacterium]|nr:DNA polymerase III subunit alpha [Paludibacteraceae bacterium]